MNRHLVYRYILDWFFPNRCPVCGDLIDYDAGFCEKCSSRLTLFDEETKIANVDLFCAGCVYDDSISPVILKLKNSRVGNGYYALALLIYKALGRNGMCSADLISYMPMTTEELKSRGYNQTELIARELGFMLDTGCMNTLVKVKEIKKQKALGRRSRERNMMNAFEASQDIALNGKRVLLIDDVCTTGSTLSEAARALKAAGAESVYAAAAAKTLKKQ